MNRTSLSLLPCFLKGLLPCLLKGLLKGLGGAALLSATGCAHDAPADERGQNIDEIQQDDVLAAIAPPEGGAAHQLANLPFVRLTLVDPATGTNGQRFLLGEVPECSLSHSATEVGPRTTYDCTVSGGIFQNVHVVAQVDYEDTPWGTDANVSILTVPMQAAVQHLGLEVHLLDTPEREHVVYTAYTAGQQVDEPATAPGGPTLIRKDQSVQAMPYWADDGSAFLVWAADPTGEEPKDIIGRPIDHPDGARLALGWEWLAPNAHIGGQPFKVPFPIRFTKYPGGWYEGAKIYRAWLETEATDKGEILELGPVAGRADISTFVKELDLIGVSNTQWYQGQPQQRENLLALSRLPGHLELDDMIYMMWGTNDPNNPYGKPGTWLPYSTLPEDTAELLDHGVRTMIYTMPQVWSANNPALFETGAVEHIAHDRTGAPLQYPWTAPDEVFADTASPFWIQFFELLASTHASTFSGARGFYTDNPYAIVDDFLRASGNLGYTKSAITGLCEINKAIRRGGKQGGGEFMTIHEGGTEKLVRCTDVEAAGAPLTRIYTPFYTADIPTSKFVPFFQAIYSGYTMITVGDPRFGTNTIPYGLWGTDGVEIFTNMARAQAMIFVLGGIQTWSELFLGEGLLTPEWTKDKLQGQDPDVVIKPFVDHMKKLIAARERNRPWLAFGELLRDPAVGGDRVVMHLRAPGTPFAPEDHDVPKVATGAYKADDGTVRLPVANAGRDDAKVILDLGRIDAAGATTLSDADAGVSFAVGSDGLVTLDVPAGAVWVLAVN